MRLIKLSIFLSLFLCGHLSAYAQKLDKTFYLLGTLDDYCGRHYPKNNPFKHGYVMVLDKGRTGEIKRIEEVVGRKFSKRKAKSICENCQDFYELKSRLLAIRINDFYSFKRSDRRDKMGFYFYTGSLLCDKITNATEEQQLSFIAGLFLTNGNLQNERYKVSLPDSPVRFECVKTILVKLGAEITREEIEKKELPSRYFLEFKPSQKITDAIAYELKRKGQLAIQF